MVVEGVPYLAAALLGHELLHMLPCPCSGKARMEDGPNLLQVSEEGRDKRSIGLKGLVFIIVISIVGQDGGAGNCFVGDGGILGVLYPKGRVIILVLRNELMFNDLDKRDTHCTPDVDQNGLYPLKCFGCRGCVSVKGYGDVIELLV
jgi:hypothetical protein